MPPVVQVEFPAQRVRKCVPMPAAAECVDEEGWPTTQRFSRRAGDCMRGAAYAAAIEGPCESRLAATAVVIAVAGALLGAAAMVFWHAG